MALFLVYSDALSLIFDSSDIYFNTISLIILKSRWGQNRFNRCGHKEIRRARSPAQRGRSPAVSLHMEDDFLSDKFARRPLGKRNEQLSGSLFRTLNRGYLF